MKTFKIIVIVLVLIIGAIITLTSCRESVDEGSYGIVDSISAIIAVSITMYLIVRAFTVKNKPHH